MNNVIDFTEYKNKKAVDSLRECMSRATELSNCYQHIMKDPNTKSLENNTHEFFFTENEIGY